MRPGSRVLERILVSGHAFAAVERGDLKAIILAAGSGTRLGSLTEVDRPERAYEVAGKASAVPWLGGKPLNMDIEVREVMSVSPVEV